MITLVKYYIFLSVMMQIYDFYYHIHLKNKLEDYCLCLLLMFTFLQFIIWIKFNTIFMGQKENSE